MILLILFFLLLLCCFPEAMARNVADALDMCLKSVVPSLFPFMIASNMLMGSAGNIKNPVFTLFARILRISPVSVWAYISGIVCGYPVGGKTALTLYDKGEISEKEKDRLLIFANNSGPGFIIGMVGGAFFKSLRVGAILYLAHILASLTYALLTAPFAEPGREVFKNNKSTPSFLNLLSESISGSISAVINITGVICFFSALTGIFDLIPFLNSFKYKGLLFGALEMTNGIKLLSAASIPLRLKAALSSFLLTLSGFCVFMQLKSFSDKIKAAAYFKGKLLCGIFSFIYTYFLI